MDGRESKPKNKSPDTSDSLPIVRVLEGNQRITIWETYIPPEDPLASPSQSAAKDILTPPPQLKSPVMAAMSSSPTNLKKSLDKPGPSVPEIKSTPFITPLKWRPDRDIYYVDIQKNNEKTHHEVYKVKKAPRLFKPPNAYIYFYKENVYKDTPMAALEAACCGFYGLIAPQQVPTARAHFSNPMNPNSKGGYSTKALPDFVNAMQDNGTLKEEDIKFDIIERKGLGALLKEELKDKNKGFFPIEKLNEFDEYIRSRKDEDIKNKDRAHELQKIKISDNPPTFISVTVGDLLNFRTIKGLAIGLTSSYIFEEDDLHRGNMSKDGKRVDFDMSCWPILSKFKESKILIDGALRIPDVTAFTPSEKDIKRFPNISYTQCPTPNVINSSPRYWPTKPPSMFDDLRVPRIAFSQKENAVYEKLESNPIFRYYKYATLLKYILTTGEMYKNIARLHVGETTTIPGTEKRVLDAFEEHENKRINAFREILTQMPEFNEFLSTHGEQVMADIHKEFSAKNETAKTKFQKIHAREEYPHKNYHLDVAKSQFINLDKIRDEYRNIKEQTANNQRKLILATYEKKISDELKSESPTAQATDYKYLMFLKYILINPEVFDKMPKNVLKAKFNFKDINLVDVVSENKQTHQTKAELLKEVLVKMPGFVEFLKKCKNVLETVIKSEFTEINTEYNKTNNDPKKKELIDIDAALREVKNLIILASTPQQEHNSNAPDKHEAPRSTSLAVK